MESLPLDGAVQNLLIRYRQEASSASSHSSRSATHSEESAKALLPELQDTVEKLTIQYKQLMIKKDNFPEQAALQKEKILINCSNLQQEIREKVEKSKPGASPDYLEKESQRKKAINKRKTELARAKEELATVEKEGADLEVQLVSFHRDLHHLTNQNLSLVAKKSHFMKLLRRYLLGSERVPTPRSKLRDGLNNLMASRNKTFARHSKMGSDIIECRNEMVGLLMEKERRLLDERARLLKQQKAMNHTHKKLSKELGSYWLDELPELEKRINYEGCIDINELRTDTSIQQLMLDS